MYVPSILGGMPKPFVGFFCLLFKEGAVDFYCTLPPGKYFPARQLEGRVFRVVAGEFVQACFAEAVGHAADAAPVDGPAAHCTGLGAGVEGAFREKWAVVFF